MKTIFPCLAAILLIALLLASTLRAQTPERESVELSSPQFVYRLDTADGLRGIAWENRMTGKSISLGNGPEVELDFDAAEQWIPIGGWRMALSPNPASSPDEDQGFRDGYYRPEFDDAGWRPIFQPAWDGPDDENARVWTRTKIALPADAKDKPLSLTLGGFSVFDYRYLRVFLNGHEIGVRNAPRPLARAAGGRSRTGEQGPPVRALRRGKPDRPATRRMRHADAAARRIESFAEPLAGDAADLARPIRAVSQDRPADRHAQAGSRLERTQAGRPSAAKPDSS